MSKSILAIDTPTACIDCPCHFADVELVWCGIEKKELLADDITSYKPDWCPLVDVSEDEAINLHMKENAHRIDVIERYLRENPDADAGECRRNVQVLAMANAALEEVRQSRLIGEWIPCAERLPEVGIPVLCQWHQRNGMDTEIYFAILHRDRDNGEWGADFGRPNGEVVAWMPLPEPYKGK